MNLIPFSAMTRIKTVIAIACFFAGGFFLGYAAASCNTPLHAQTGREIGAPGILPNPELTPGAIRLTSAASVCRVKWGRDRRHVTTAMKRQVCLAYGVSAADCNGKNYEIDHLIPRELGGADDVRNLWPQPWPQARQKDRLENLLHRETCAGRLSLREAQQTIRTDWYSEYLQLFGAKP